MRGLIIFLLFTCGLAAQNAPKRLALLLGNSGYQHLPALPDAGKQLDELSSALRDAGFTVTQARDVTQQKLASDILLNFLKNMRPGDICFFYFSGYATQAQQDNYLLPIEFNPAAQPDMSGAISLTGIQQRLDATQAGLKILALEASRRDSRLITQGFGLSNPDVGDSHEILFAFSALPNQWAPDNSAIFTHFLAAAIRKKGLTLDAVFRDVYKETFAATSGKQQTSFQPFVTQDFFFHEAEKPEIATPPPPVETGRKAGTLLTNHKDREDYVWIPAGTFKMGCVPEDPKCKPEEKPQHTVTLAHGYWLGRNEVQTGSYQRYVDDDKKVRKMPARAPGWDGKWKLASYPIVEVTWEEANAYCAWAGGRLPTEAEWERAARAGQDDKTYPMTDFKTSREKANFAGVAGNDKWEQAAPVRSFDANAYGLFDMAGNVWEWCFDLFGKSYYAESPAKDPMGPSGDEKLHVVRGGSWFSDEKQHLRISYRESHKGGNNVGFRCMLPDNSATDELLKPR